MNINLTSKENVHFDDDNKTREIVLSNCLIWNCIAKQIGMSYAIYMEIGTEHALTNSTPNCQKCL